MENRGVGGNLLKINQTNENAHWMKPNIKQIPNEKRSTGQSTKTKIKDVEPQEKQQGNKTMTTNEDRMIEVFELDGDLAEINALGKEDVSSATPGCAGEEAILERVKETLVWRKVAEFTLNSSKTTLDSSEGDTETRPYRHQDEAIYNLKTFTRSGASDNRQDLDPFRTGLFNIGEPGSGKSESIMDFLFLQPWNLESGLDKILEPLEKNLNLIVGHLRKGDRIKAKEALAKDNFTLNQFNKAKFIYRVQNNKNLKITVLDCRALLTSFAREAIGNFKDRLPSLEKLKSLVGSNEFGALDRKLRNLVKTFFENVENLGRPKPLNKNAIERIKIIDGSSPVKSLEAMLRKNELEFTCGDHRYLIAFWAHPTKPHALWETVFGRFTWGRLRPGLFRALGYGETMFVPLYFFLTKTFHKRQPIWELDEDAQLNEDVFTKSEVVAIQSLQCRHEYDDRAIVVMDESHVGSLSSNEENQTGTNIKKLAFADTSLLLQITATPESFPEHDSQLILNGCGRVYKRDLEGYRSLEAYRPQLYTYKTGGDERDLPLLLESLNFCKHHYVRFLGGDQNAIEEKDRLGRLGELLSSPSPDMGVLRELLDKYVMILIYVAIQLQTTLISVSTHDDVKTLVRSLKYAKNTRLEKVMLDRDLYINVKESGTLSEINLSSFCHEQLDDFLHRYEGRLEEVSLQRYVTTLHKVKTRLKSNEGKTSPLRIAFTQGDGNFEIYEGMDLISSKQRPNTSLSSLDSTALIDQGHVDILVVVQTDLRAKDFRNLVQLVLARDNQTNENVLAQAIGRLNRGFKTPTSITKSKDKECDKEFWEELERMTKSKTVLKPRSIILNKTPDQMHAFASTLNKHFGFEVDQLNKLIRLSPASLPLVHFKKCERCGQVSKTTINIEQNQGKHECPRSQKQSTPRDDALIDAILQTLSKHCIPSSLRNKSSSPSRKSVSLQRNASQTRQRTSAPSRHLDLPSTTRAANVTCVESSSEEEDDDDEDEDEDSKAEIQSDSCSEDDRSDGGNEQLEMGESESVSDSDSEDGKDTEEETDTDDEQPLFALGNTPRRNLVSRNGSESEQGDVRDGNHDSGMKRNENPVNELPNGKRKRLDQGSNNSSSEEEEEEEEEEVDDDEEMTPSPPSKRAKKQLIQCSSCRRRVKKEIPSGSDKFASLKQYSGKYGTVLEQGKEECVLCLSENCSPCKEGDLLGESCKHCKTPMRVQFSCEKLSKGVVVLTEYHKVGDTKERLCKYDFGQGKTFIPLHYERKCKIPENNVCLLCFHESKPKKPAFSISTTTSQLPEENHLGELRTNHVSPPRNKGYEKHDAPSVSDIIKVQAEIQDFLAANTKKDTRLYKEFEKKPLKSVEHTVTQILLRKLDGPENYSDYAGTKQPYVLKYVFEDNEEKFQQLVHEIERLRNDDTDIEM